MHTNLRPHPRLALQLDSGTEVLHDMLHDRKPETRASGLLGPTLVDPIEALKYPLLIRLRNPNSCVPDNQDDFISFLAQRDVDVTAGIIVAHCIVAQVVNELLIQPRIADSQAADLI